MNTILAPIGECVTSFLNFAIIGQIRSGATVVQSTIDQVAQVVCHANLLDDDEKVRRAAHENYFGAGKNPERSPEWLVTAQTNVYAYLGKQVFDNPRCGEAVVGVRVLYHQFCQYALNDLFQDRCREGDFCLIHVVRNPLACFVSRQQALRSGVWQLSSAEAPSQFVPPALRVDRDEFLQFARDHEAAYLKVKYVCDDIREVSYRDLCHNFENTMQRLFDFLELPPQRLPEPGIRRLRNTDVRSRIRNWDELYKSGGKMLRDYMDAKDLF